MEVNIEQSVSWVRRLLEVAVKASLRALTMVCRSVRRIPVAGEDSSIGGLAWPSGHAPELDSPSALTPDVTIVLSLKES